MIYDAFISHAGADLDVATRLNDALKGEGFKTFFSPSDLPGACFVTPGLARAVEESKVLVLLISPASAESRWVRMEADIASRTGKVVAPVRLSDFFVPIGNGLYPYTFDVNYIDFFPDWNAGERRLRSVLRKDRDEGNDPPAPEAKSSLETRAGRADERRQGIHPDPRRVMEDLQKRVARGEKEAMYMLGRLLLARETTTDDAQAVRLFRLASEGREGLPQAHHTLADCYRKNRGVGRSFSKMREFYELAAMRGYAPSFYNLGRTYENGWGVRADLVRAYHRYVAGANLGYAPAQFAVARMSFVGAGVLVNDANALSFAQLAAAQHYGPALNLMGRIYRLGRGVLQSDTEACKWYEKATDQGDASGILNLASMYERGLGVAKDAARAKSLRVLADEIEPKTGN